MAVFPSLNRWREAQPGFRIMSSLSGPVMEFCLVDLVLLLLIGISCVSSVQYHGGRYVNDVTRRDEKIRTKIL